MFVAYGFVSYCNLFNHDFMNEPDFKVRLLSEYSKEDLEVLYGAIRTTVEVTKLMPDDPIKALEMALNIFKLEKSLNFGICDALNFAVKYLDYPSMFSNPSYYGIELPEKIYDGVCRRNLFSYPCTLEGRQQRIEVLQEAINRLKQPTMNKQEREAFIDKLIKSQHKGARPIDYLVYTDRFNALNKLSDEELLKQNPDLN